MFGIHRNGLCYKWIVLFKGQFYKGSIGKLPFLGHFPNMTVLYPNLCYNEVCDKGTALNL